MLFAIIAIGLVLFIVIIAYDTSQENKKTEKMKEEEREEDEEEDSFLYYDGWFDEKYDSVTFIELFRTV